MLIYLVEDDALKASQIRAMLTDKFQPLSVHIYQSYHSGLAAIVARAPDLVLLDMTLPTFDRSPSRRAGRLRPLGGYELMRKIAPGTCKIVIVTMLENFGEGDREVGVEDVEAMCSHDFPELYVGLVRFQLGSSAWREKLAALVNIVRETKV